MEHAANYTDQTTRQLLLKIVEDGKKYNPEDPAAYALSVLAACFNITFANLAERCQNEEIEEIRQRLERVVNISIDIEESKNDR